MCHQYNNQQKDSSLSERSQRYVISGCQSGVCARLDGDERQQLQAENGLAALHSDTERRETWRRFTQSTSEPAAKCSLQSEQ